MMPANNGKLLLGKEGERLAERYLQNKGYKLVERNYRCRAGELDLIVLRSPGGRLRRSEDADRARIRHAA